MRNYKDRITVNEDGAFIPREMFGQKEEILDELNQAGVFSPLSDQQTPPTQEEPKRPRRVEMPDRSRELRWVKEHRSEYLDQWVALEGDRLVSHGATAREVLLAARQAGVDIPLLIHIDPVEELPLGGW